MQETLELRVMTGGAASLLDGAGAATTTAANRETRSSTLENMTTDYKKDESVNKIIMRNWGEEKKESTGPRKRLEVKTIQRSRPLYSGEKKQ